jgi:hypothetical protein
MTRWLPHIYRGGASSECPSDCGTKSGRDGVYLDVCWLGFMLSVAVYKQTKSTCGSAVSE